MKVCPNKNCGATDIAPDARYCPHCGKLFPFAKDVKLLELGQWDSLKKKSKLASGKTSIDKAEYNRIVNSYNNMVNNGYASPVGDKELIADDELQQLRKNARVLDSWKRECERRRNTPIYDYKDEYTHDFYWGNALLGAVTLGAVIFWLFFAIPTIWRWIFGPDEPKTGIEIVLNEKTGKYGIVNHRIDSLVTPYSYDTIIHRNRNGYNYYQLVLKAAGKLGIADSAGYRTIGGELDSIKEQGYNLSVIYKNDKQGIISHVGQTILDPSYYRVLFQTEPYYSADNIITMMIPGRYIGNIIPVIASKGEKWSLIARDGRKLTYEKFYSVSQVCHPNLLKVATSYNKWGLIDIHGYIILPCSYDYIYMFSEDMAWVKKTHKDPWICISSKGEKLGTLSDEYSPKGVFSSGLSPVSYGKAPYSSNIGYSNSKGEIVIPAKYGYYHTSSGAILWPSPSFRGDSALVSYKGKNGVLWKDGTFKPKE